jgi:hypothetical protein
MIFFVWQFSPTTGLMIRSFRKTSLLISKRGGAVAFFTKRQRNRRAFNVNPNVYRKILGQYLPSLVSSLSRFIKHG